MEENTNKMPMVTTGTPGYATIRGQSTMALDVPRNKAYLAAMGKVITKDSVVLDLGAGLGTLGLLAAKLGAKKIYYVEPSPVIKMIPKLAKANGVADKVTCFQGKIEEIELPEKVDVILSVFTGIFLLGENLLPSLFYARDHYLKEGGTLLPEKGRMWSVPANLEHTYSQRVGKFREKHLGLGVSLLAESASNVVESFRPGKKRKELKYLAEPACLKSIDFNVATKADCHESCEYAINSPGEIHGFLGWFDMLLADQWLSTAPHDQQLHWSSLFLMCEQPIEVEIEDPVFFKLNKSEKAGWNWVITHKQQTQRQSELKTWLNPMLPQKPL